MKNKIAITLIVILLFVLGGLVLFGDYPLILITNQKELVLMNKRKVEGLAIINPLADIEFNTGKNSAYLIFSKQDRQELPAGMNRRKVYICKDNVDLKSLKDDFFFLQSNGDIATCESDIFILKDNKIIFHSGLVFTDSIIGLQDGSFGWIDAINQKALKQHFLNFKPINYPIIIL